MSHFFAYLSRLKFIDRWSLMRCVQRENVQEHSLQVAMIAHAIALIKRKHFGATHINPERVALLAIYHDATEVLTGDLPTPVKYFNGDISAAYRKIETHAAEKLVNLLPQELRTDFAEILSPQDKESKEIVKAADTLCAYIKCLEERAAGNHEFTQAQKSIEKKIDEIRSRPEIKYFIDNFIPSFKLTLDEISESGSAPL